MPSSSSPPGDTPQPDLLYTSAANTIEAQLSPTAIPATEEPTGTITPTVWVPTLTPEPTNTSTPTDAPTSTDAPTPTEIPQVILYDDFSDTSGWYTHEDDDYGFKYSADGYHIYNNIKMGTIWSIRDQEFSSVALEVDGTRLTGAEDSFFGVVCNLSEDGDNYYTLVLGDNGFYGFGMMDNGEFEFIATGLDEDDIINRGQGKTNRIRGVCNDDHFLIYANGELLLDAWDNSLNEGKIGLAVGNQRSDKGSEFRFNDFAITWP